MANAPDRQHEPWHLDKRVPIVLVFMILLQTGSAGWWLSAQSQSISQHDKDISALQGGASEQSKAIQRLELRSAALEQGNATIIEQNRQLASDVRELTRSMIRLETIMRPAGNGEPARPFGSP